MRIKSFNEEVGFDDEETRDRLEIPNMRGEFEPDSSSMKPFYLPTNKVNTQTEIKKIVFREPILDRFQKDIKLIEGSKLISFYATTKFPVDEKDFYAQLSFAFHNGQYYIGTIMRNREDWQDEEKWVRHTFFFDTIEDTFKVADAFVKCCEDLGIIDSGDLENFLPEQN